MLFGFNLLLWTTHVTSEHFPIIAELKKAGYDGIELPVFEGDPAHYAEIGKVAADNGLRVTAVTVLPDVETSAISADPAARKRAQARIGWALDCTKAAGGELLCGPFFQALGVFTGEPVSTAETDGIVEVHSAAADYAQTLGLKLSVEPLNRFEAHALNTVEQAAAVVKRVDRPNYGLLYDTFHANVEEKDPIGALANNLAYINHVHLSENDRGTPGKGHIPFRETLAVLKGNGYAGWCTIEAFGRALPALAAATRVWRDFFPAREEVYRFGHDHLREQWERA